MSSQKSFTVDARTILQLGRQSIKDHTTALLELVKNSYDADANVVEVEIMQDAQGGYVKVVDNGIGMTEEEVDKNWLRIGYSEKRSNKFSKRHRRKTGEKGVGRISSDRLGSHFELRTKSEFASPYGLIISWDDFDVEGIDLASVPINIIQPVELTLPQNVKSNTNTGTELIIRNLRHEWTRDDIKHLREELAILTPPFDAVSDFQIHLKADVTDEFNGPISSPFYNAAEFELTAQLDGDLVNYTISDRVLGSDLRQQVSNQISWQQMAQRNSLAINAESVPRTGPVKIHLLFYRRSSELLEDTAFSLRDLKDFLDANAGIKIYRDHIRVRPYGDPDSPEGDWLNLAERKSREPAGVARDRYRFSANQVVGAVFLTRDENPALEDSAAREGFIQGDAFTDLRTFSLGCITLLEAHRHQKFLETLGIKSHTPYSGKIFSELTSNLFTLRNDLIEVRNSIGDDSPVPMAKLRDQIIAIEPQIEKADAAIQEVLSQSGVLRGLATLGIASSVFGHETQIAISSFLTSIRYVRDVLCEDGVIGSDALEEIEKAIKYGESVSNWGAFALARVKRDKREKRKISVDETLKKIANDLANVYRSASIDLTTSLVPVAARTFEMDIEAAAINLLTNAYVACQQSRRARVVRLSVEPSFRQSNPGFEITVSDSGPGVPDNLYSKIWEPLFSFRGNTEGKAAGTGLGLFIVNSVVSDLGGEKEVSISADLGGAEFTLWFPNR